jgi:protocatechuate 3,4-dioxygenase beta subunit
VSGVSLDDEARDEGLRQDLPRLLATAHDRRQVLTWILAGGAALAIGACSSGSGSAGTADDGSDDDSSGVGTSTDPDSCVLPDEETAGPYPADGSNTRDGSVVNVLEESGVVRSDIRSSIGAASGTASGVPLTLTLKLLDVNNLCAPLARYVVYLWHCTADGNYSLYSESVENENFLRGAQAADANGELTFTTIFPGCYAGRYPHIHFEVYPSLDMATLYTNRVLTSQIALPAEVCNAVYATNGYSASASNFSRTSLVSDGIFSNNSDEQMAVVTPALSGDTETGFEGTLTIGVAGI